jgi:uncharacterized membrane protein YhaH (DUF805 family)
MDMFIKVVRDNYTNFEGRARRKEFWMFTLVSLVINVGTLILDASLFSDLGLVNGLYTLAILLPSIAVGIRRMHDINKSGWWLLLWIVPVIGWVWLIILHCRDSDIGDNIFGPSDKYPDANDSDVDFLLDEEE